MDPLEQLIAKLQNAARLQKPWPLQEDRDTLTLINTWIALRENDTDTIRNIAGYPKDKRYRIDPLADRISEAWAHYLWHDAPQVAAAVESDQPLLEGMLERDWPAELERAAALCVSEGEIWSRVLVAPAVSPRPILEWHSRKHVVPLWVGERCPAVALTTTLPPHGTDKKVTWRAFECHGVGVVRNLLFRGSDGKLGREVALDEHPDTAELPPEWRHDLPVMLMHRIHNRVRGSRKLGISDYAGILDFLLELNEAFSTGSHNQRLSARKRAVVTAAALKRPTLAEGDDTTNSIVPPAPKFDPTEEIYVDDPLDAELGSGQTQSPFKLLEYSFDADPLIRWKSDLVESALTRVGLSPQFAGLGAGAEGYAISGTALRIRLIPQDNTGGGKARSWMIGLPLILSTMAMVDRLPSSMGGFGRPWTDPVSLPTVTRLSGLPPDDLEEAQRHQALRAAGVESRHQAVRELHPDWDEADVADEVTRILDEQSSSPAAGLFGV